MDDQKQSFLGKRLGDVAVIVMAAAVLGVASLMGSLYLGVSRQDSANEATAERMQSQMDNIKANMEMQLNVMSSVVNRVTEGGFTARQGATMQTQIEHIRRALDVTGVRVGRVEISLERMNGRIMVLERRLDDFTGTNRGVPTARYAPRPAHELGSWPPPAPQQFRRDPVPRPAARRQE